MTLTTHCRVTGSRSQPIGWYRVRPHEGRVLLTFARPGCQAEGLLLGPALAATIEDGGRIVFDSRAEPAT